jgi:heme/copper-type cytochrome/quinol oxidase subunit 3
MSDYRIVSNVTELPSTVYGHRSLMWWGTLGFIMIEGSTLFICAISYFYIRRNFESWPPAHVLRPGLTVATVQVALMVLSNLPMRWVDRAARRIDLRSVQVGMVVCTALALAMCVLRVFEFRDLNVRWDSNAYGTVAWATVFAHGTLLLLETLESIVFTALLFSPSLEQRDLASASDNAVYWYFLTLSWVPLYVIVYLSPYLIP